MADRSADWLAQAQIDLGVAQLNYENQFYEWACFVAQQASEKAVKALYQHVHGEAWGHSITELFRDLPSDVQPANDLLDSARVLDKYYTQTRYPNGFAEGFPHDYFTRREAEEALAYAKAIIQFCQSKIS